MLELKEITKEYPSAGTTVRALKGVSVAFRNQEFVSILGQSGCGKTTLLNIIGGLDHYTSGDLVINGRSTKSYRDRDWDTYRNHSVGFVFQSYNLIPHQSVVANVEMALLLSGVSKAERRRRAEDALRQVGLADHLHKRPNQLSGGQMQRVAIARAIVNDPEIILADEPTGALDTETSVEVMETLKQLSHDRLVIMVTHNPQLAEEYSDRIVRIQDGLIVDDTHPVDLEAEALTPEEVAAHAEADKKKGKRGMGYPSAVALSFTNLMTKKGRTILTVFAGSIGIIGIALILSLSSGTQNYITHTEETTMGSYPLTIQRTSVDMSAMMGAMMGGKDDTSNAPSGKAESNNIVGDMVSSMAEGATENDMAAIKTWLDSNPGDIKSLTTDIQYKYDTPLTIYASDTSSSVVQVNPATVMDALGFSTSGSTQTQMMSAMSAAGSGYDVWHELLDNKQSQKRDWEVVAGHMPTAWNEAVVALDEHGKISDYTLYALGLLDQSDLSGMMNDALAGKKVNKTKDTTYSYDDLMNLTFKVLPQTAKYSQNADGTWSDRSSDEQFMRTAVDAAEPVRIVGVVKATADNSTGSGVGEVLYSSALIEHLAQEVNSSPIVAAQQASKDTDIFTGLPFTDTSTPMTSDQLNALMASMPVERAAQLQGYMASLRAQGMSEAQVNSAVSKQLASLTAGATYDTNLQKLGVADMDDPSTIQIYPVDFEAKEQIDSLIDSYNEDVRSSGKGVEIQYSDIVGTMMSSVTSIVNAISYILIAFVAISLVVSSIMIGIITYISVLERTKEIGILRAIGASKRDVSRVFTAETLIIGAASGAFAIVFTLVALIPINMVIEQVANVSGLAALPVVGAVILVAISMLLTLAAGFAPSRMAAKKDPVAALRTE